MFIEVLLFSETFPALKNSWLRACIRPYDIVLFYCCCMLSEAVVSFSPTLKNAFSFIINKMNW